MVGGTSCIDDFGQYSEIAEPESSFCPAFLFEAINRMIHPNPRQRFK